MDTELTARSPALFGVGSMLFVVVFVSGLQLWTGWGLVAADMDFERVMAITNVIGLLLFVPLMLKLARCSPAEFWRATAPRQPLAGSDLSWFLLIIPLGILGRLGAGGLVALVKLPFDPGSLAADYRVALAAAEAAATWPNPLLYTLYPLLTALREELVYRRVIQWRLTLRFGEVRGLLLAAACFALPHLSPTLIVAAPAICIIYAVSGRLWVTIGVHLVSNAVAVLLPLLMQGIPWPAFAAIYVVSAVALLAFLAWACRSIRRRAPTFAAAIALGKLA